MCHPPVEKLVIGGQARATRAPEVNRVSAPYIADLRHTQLADAFGSGPSWLTVTSTPCTQVLSPMSVL